MSHARIEEVEDSDVASDPSEGDISDVTSDFSDSDIIKKRTAPAPTTNRAPSNARASQINPANIPSTGQLSTASDGTNYRNLEDSSQYKDFQCIYPVYFDATRSRAEGRRVGMDLAVKNPIAKEIVTCCSMLGIETLFEPMKTHPKDWANPGRVKVKVRGGRNPAIKNKHHLYTIIAKHLQTHPATPATAMQPRISGIPPPDPSKPLAKPAIPKGWKISETLPYYSAALSGGGVSENFFKDMMAEMQGQIPGMPDMGSSSSTAGAQQVEPKKKDKKKKVKG